MDTTGRRCGVSWVTMIRTRWPAGMAILWMVIAVSGCRTPDPLGPAVSGRIQPGMTSEQVHQWLGYPTQVEQGRSGRTVEMYETLETIFGSYGVREREEALEIRQFSVRYHPEGTVEKTMFHRGVLEGFTMVYSRSLGPEINPEKLSKVRSGRSTRAEVEALFGPPSLARLDLDEDVRLEWIYDYVEAGAVTPGRVYRSIEVTVDTTGVVRSMNAVDRVFPTWRR